MPRASGSAHATPYRYGRARTRDLPRPCSPRPPRTLRREALLLERRQRRPAVRATAYRPPPPARARPRRSGGGVGVEGKVARRPARDAPWLPGGDIDENAASGPAGAAGRRLGITRVQGPRP